MSNEAYISNVNDVTQGGHSNIEIRFLQDFSHHPRRSEFKVINEGHQIGRFLFSIGFGPLHGQKLSG